MAKVVSFGLSMISVLNLKKGMEVVYWMNTVDSSLEEKEIIKIEKEQFGDMPYSLFFGVQ